MEKAFIRYYLMEAFIIFLIITNMIFTLDDK